MEQLIEKSFQKGGIIMSNFEDIMREQSRTEQQDLLRFCAARRFLQYFKKSIPLHCRKFKINNVWTRYASGS